MRELSAPRVVEDTVLLTISFVCVCVSHLYVCVYGCVLVCVHACVGARGLS